LEKKRICLLTSGHPPFDERIFWKFGKTMVENKFDVVIIASTTDLHTTKEDIQLNCFSGVNLNKKNKIEKFYKSVLSYKPDVIICFEHLPVIAASKYKSETDKNVKLILDITEYYPHQNTLNEFMGVIKFLKFIQLFLFNIYISNLVDSIIIGETNKAKLYNWIAPFKTKTIIGYYAPKKHFNFTEPALNQLITFCFLGEQSKERGFFNFLELISKVSNNSLLKFKVILIGSSFKDNNIQNSLLKCLINSNNVEIEQTERIDYNKLGEVMSKSNFFIDLREKNKIFNKSLPIRVFDYMACGRPIIFSNLDSLSGFTDIKLFTHLIEPNDVNKAVSIISYYLNNRNIYLAHCKAARKQFYEKYNWEFLESKLLEIID
jgi:glycosyltransferase involved in cell wall biosynthesis